MKATSIGPVSPDERIEANDRLVFTGMVGTIVDLEKIPGLVPAADARYEVLPVMQRGRQLCEAVISPSSPLWARRCASRLPRALRRGDRRRASQWLAAPQQDRRHRAPRRRHAPAPGRARLQQGYRNNPDFYLVSDVEDSRPVRHGRARVAAIIFAIMITGFVSGKIDICLGGVPGRRAP